MRGEEGGVAVVSAGDEEDGEGEGEELHKGVPEKEEGEFGFRRAEGGVGGEGRGVGDAEGDTDEEGDDHQYQRPHRQHE